MPEPANAARLREMDKARLQNPDSWPNDPVCMKTLPWLPGEQRFGMLSSKDPLTVTTVTDPPETFDSLDALLAVWCTD